MRARYATLLVREWPIYLYGSKMRFSYVRPRRKSLRTFSCDTSPFTTIRYAIATYTL